MLSGQSRMVRLCFDKLLKVAKKKFFELFLLFILISLCIGTVKYFQRHSWYEQIDNCISKNDIESGLIPSIEYALFFFF